jgi:D-amino-acid dehydrogenase
VDPQRLARRLADDFVAAGGEVVPTRVERIAAADDGVSLATAAGERRFDKVVVAAGAWSRGLARDSGVRVPLDTERGYHAMLPDPGVEVRVPMISGDHSIAITPMSEGLRVSGTVEFAGLRAAPDYARAERLVELAERLLPGLRPVGAKFWLGFRPSLPDSLPVIGPSPRQHNVLLAFGHGHLGVTFAAVTGTLIADLAAARSPAIDLAPFSPARFA